MTADVVALGDGELVASVEPASGARVSSLRWRGTELLVTSGRAPFGRHAFVMAPWAGRVRDATATFEGRTLPLPVGDPPHAIHGLVHDRATATLERTRTTLVTRAEVAADEWFAPLTCTQRLTVTEGRLELDLEVAAPHTPAPATVGWHPWFRRDLDGAPVELQLPRGRMLQRAADGIATPERVSIPDGPLDDALVDLDGPVRLRYPGRGTVEVAGDGPVVVVYTEHPSGICVEPQTGPPDEVNLPTPRLATPDRPLRLRASVTFTPA